MEGAEALSTHYEGLYRDFSKFFPELLAFSGSRVIRPQSYGSKLPEEIMVIKPDIPRKVRVLQKIDCQKEE